MIGIFDSGIGGLTVVKEISKQLPDYNIVYFGDVANLPYGNKSAEKIIEYAIKNTEFLIKQGAKIIVVACNTASAVATDELKKKFDVPIFGVIEPAVEKAIKVSKDRIGVIGTRGTINSKIYEQKILEKNRDLKVFQKECPLLVPLIEENWSEKRETKMIVKKYLHNLKEQEIDTLILGCTHYPLLKDLIQIKIGRRVQIVDSAVEVAKKVKKYLDENPESKKNKNNQHKFFVSDITPHFEEIAGKWLDKKVELEKVNLQK